MEEIQWSYVTKLYELQLFLDCDIGELMGRMFIIDRFKINQQFLETLGYHHNLIIFPSMTYEVLIESS